MTGAEVAAPSAACASVLIVERSHYLCWHASVELPHNNELMGFHRAAEIGVRPVLQKLKTGNKGVVDIGRGLASVL